MDKDALHSSHLCCAVYADPPLWADFQTWTVAITPLNGQEGFQWAVQSDQLPITLLPGIHCPMFLQQVLGIPDATHCVSRNHCSIAGWMQQELDLDGAIQLDRPCCLTANDAFPLAGPANGVLQSVCDGIPNEPEATDCARSGGSITVLHPESKRMAVVMFSPFSEPPLDRETAQPFSDAISRATQICHAFFPDLTRTMRCLDTHLKVDREGGAPGL